MYFLLSCDERGNPRFLDCPRQEELHERREPTGGKRWRLTKTTEHGVVGGKEGATFPCRRGWIGGMQLRLTMVQNRLISAVLTEFRAISDPKLQRDDRIY